MSARGLTALLLGSCTACAAAAPVGPEQAAAAYLGALARGDHAAARGWSVEPVRSSTEAWTPPPAELRGAHWRLVLGDGRELWLVEERPGQWRVDDRLRLGLDTGEPLGAARAFLAAALSQDLPRVRAFLPEHEQSALADDGRLRAYLEALRARLERAAAGIARDVAAAIDGDRAQIPYGDQRVLRLLRERGGWRVLDLE